MFSSFVFGVFPFSTEGWGFILLSFHSFPGNLQKKFAQLSKIWWECGRGMEAMWFMSLHLSSISMKIGNWIGVLGSVIIKWPYLAFQRFRFRLS